MYHGVSGKKNFSINGRHLPAEEFEKHLKYYIKNFDVVPLRELCKESNSPKLGKNAIALTFDDGYLNNIRHAIPILQKYNIPATFFVTTLCLTDPEYIHPSDYIDLIATSTRKSIDINGVTFQSNGRQLMHHNYTAYSYVNSLNFGEFKNTIKHLTERYPVEKITLNVDSDVYQLVTVETLTTPMFEKLFTLGSHSHDHVNLASLTREQIAYQLGTSKKILQDKMLSSVDCLAFPYGFFNQEVIEESVKQGYQYLLAGGSISDEWKTTVFPRIGILNMAGYAFNMLSINRGFQNFGF